MKFMLLLVALYVAYQWGWHAGARWLKETIEREANVTIDCDMRITPNQPPQPEKEDAP